MPRPVELIFVCLLMAIAWAFGALQMELEIAKQDPFCLQPPVTYNDETKVRT